MTEHWALCCFSEWESELGQVKLDSREKSWERMSPYHLHKVSQGDCIARLKGLSDHFNAWQQELVIQQRDLL